MRHRRAALATLVVAVFAGLVGGGQRVHAQPRRAPGGTITGHIGYAGKAPGNPVIRMSVDPQCADINRGKMVIQEQALVARDGSVANTFVRLEGTFPPAAVPATPVVIDQRACVYGPRVVGLRVGQRLQIRNDDPLLHNVHSSSAGNNGFNVGQPKAGMVFEFVPATPEVMVRLGCDVHRWMTAFIGVVAHPYFAVSDVAGHFAIAGVPAGTYTLRTWHEQFGERESRVTVRAGATSAVDLIYQ